MVRTLALPAALALTLVGCVAPPDGAGGGPGGPGAPEEGATEALALYLTGSPGLTTGAPTGTEPEAVASGNFFTRWGQAEGYAEFVGEPMPWSALVTGPVNLTVFARADGPALQAGVFPHFIAYFGSEAVEFPEAPGGGGFYNADGSADASPAMRPGDVAEFTVTITPPETGMLVPAGARPRVLLVAVMTQDERSGDVTFLVNSTATPSRVEFTATRVADPPALGDFEGGNPSGTVAGSAYAPVPGDAPVVGGAFARASYPIEVPAGAARVWVALQVEQAAGFADLDLAIAGPDGAEVARSVTPTSVEKIALYPHQLGDGGAFTATVTNYGSAAAQFMIDIRVYEPLDG